MNDFLKHFVCFFFINNERNTPENLYQLLTIGALRSIANDFIQFFNKKQRTHFQ